MALNDSKGNLIGVTFWSEADEKTHAVSGWLTGDGSFVISLGDYDVIKEVTITKEALDNIQWASVVQIHERAEV